MKNPNRYDSEFPGAEMQSFSTNSQFNIRQNRDFYVE